jgi:Ca-activated chloride channel family protein
LISYSSDTHVIIETSSNLDKAACIEAIRSLEAGGNTAGAKAVKKAREVALKQFIEDGNNEVFLATDGAFNEGVEKALRESRKMDRNDVRLSVLGIKCGPFTTKQMKQLVSEGSGGFIPVVTEGEAGDQLIQQVKNNSAYN